MIVINYRRSDSGGYALFFHQALLKAFPGRVFLDVGGELTGNGDYTKIIIQRVTGCKVLLSLVGQSWLEVSNAQGRRLDDPNDLVRREIDIALQLDKPVIPVLLNGASMPLKSMLPDCISDLSKQDAVLFRHERFEDDLRNVISAIRRRLQPSHAAAAATKSRVPTIPSFNPTPLNNLLASLPPRQNSLATPSTNALAGPVMASPTMTELDNAFFGLLDRISQAPLKTDK